MGRRSRRGCRARTVTANVSTVLSPRVPELAALDVLVSVARLGSMSAAAREHDTSQQAVSARVRSTEREIGIRIFDRSTRGVSITAEGVAVLEWAGAVLAAATTFASGVDALLDEGRANLTVAASMTLAEHLVPSWIVTMRRRHPEVTIRMRLMNSAEVAEQVLDGRADLGFVEGPAIPAGLAERAVARDELVVVTGPEHPWARRGTVGLTELAATALVQREAGSGTRTTYERVVRPTAAPLLELESVTAIKSAVLTANAPSVLSSLSISADVRDGRLKAIEVIGVTMPRLLRAVWDAREPLRGASRDFVDTAVEALAHAVRPTSSASSASDRTADGDIRA